MNELDEYFTNAILPKGPIQLNAHTYISDIKTFVKAALDKARAGNFQSRVSLLQLKDYLQSRKDDAQPAAD